MPTRKLNTNWISKYLEVMEPLTEAPSSYTIWCAISVISATLKKKVWVKRGPYDIYPNQYIVLVGPPGVGKGSAIHPAHSFVKAFKPTLANYLSDRVTAERIIQLLAAGFQTQAVVNGQVIATTESAAVLQATELSTLLSSSDWMTSFLCAAWDQNEYEHNTKNKGSAHVKDMCLSLIGACVPDFIRKINSKMALTDTINGGFTARTIFVFANQPSKRLPWPIALANTKQGPQLIQDFRDDLEAISKIKGEYTFTQDAVTLWTKWYNNIRIDDSDSDVVRHFKSRQNVHVLKVAMCLSAAHSDLLLIDQWALQTAIALVQNVLDTLDVVFRGVGESSLAEATAKIQTFIESKGMVTRKEILKYNTRHATMEDIDRILATLEAIGLVEGFIRGQSQWYKFTPPTAQP